MNVNGKQPKATKQQQQKIKIENKTWKERIQ